MTTKTTGAEFKRFYLDDTIWLEGVYHDDQIITADGVEIEDEYEKIADDAKVTIEGGGVYGPQFNGNEPSMETFFKRWKKVQTTTSFVVECHIDKEALIKEQIKCLGGKVLNG